jgi:hypothetical protein
VARSVAGCNAVSGSRLSMEEEVDEEEKEEVSIVPTDVF